MDTEFLRFDLARNVLAAAGKRRGQRFDSAGDVGTPGIRSHKLLQVDRS